MTEAFVNSPPPPAPRSSGWRQLDAEECAVSASSVKSSYEKTPDSRIAKPHVVHTNQGLVRLDTFSLSHTRSPDFAFSSVAFTALSPCRALSIFASEAKGTSVSAKIACKFATSHCSEAIRCISNSVIKPLPREQWSTVLLESALSSGNDALYSLGTRLAATGRVRTNFTGFVVAGPSVAVARLGGGCLYLSRRGKLFPFFFGEDNGPKLGESGDIELHVVSSRLEKGDTIFIFSRSLAKHEEHSLLDILEEKEANSNNHKNLTNVSVYSSCVFTSFAGWCETMICKNQPVGFAARLTLG